MVKYIFITGGVVSSLGKGIAAASLGALLQARGFKVRLRKLDPYLNVDPGTMSPSQHGEVFVTEDGGETDLDLGHYERFTSERASLNDNITSGKVYMELLTKERRGDYLGATVQVIPHVTSLIKDFITNQNGDEDFIICEIGGTVGDIEALPYFEAIRQLAYELDKKQSIFLHTTLVPYIKAAKEIKTKPTQHSVKELRAIGIIPNILLCRTEHKIADSEKDKIAKFCNVDFENVIQAPDVKNIYEAPLCYHKEGLDYQIMQEFSYDPAREIDLSKWHKLIDKSNNLSKTVKISIVSKYLKVLDAYKSLKEALDHAGIAEDCNVEINWVNARNLNQNNIETKLKDSKAIIIPGGFGGDGTKGKILATKYARENNIAFLGICYGMQLAVIEFMQNVAGFSEATSSELDNTENQKPKVIGLLTEWVKDSEIVHRYSNQNLGGTMRLGGYKCRINKSSLAYKIYNTEIITERHRHRYEVNTNYQNDLQQNGMIISGYSEDNVLPEIVEITQHKFFIGVQFHPEFNSSPFNPSPLFTSLIRAALN